MFRRHRQHKPLHPKVNAARDYLQTGGLGDNPNDDAVLLLVSEIRSLNGRVNYVLGVLSIIVVLFLGHVFVAVF